MNYIKTPSAGGTPMRCSCRECGTYMSQSEGSALGCICPDCGARCSDCLGTDCALDRRKVLSIKNDAAFADRIMARLRDDSEQTEG